MGLGPALRPFFGVYVARVSLGGLLPGLMAVGDCLYLREDILGEVSVGYTEFRLDEKSA